MIAKNGSLLNNQKSNPHQQREHVINTELVS